MEHLSLLREEIMNILLADHLTKNLKQSSPKNGLPHSQVMVLKPSLSKTGQATLEFLRYRKLMMIMFLESCHTLLKAQQAVNSRVVWYFPKFQLLPTLTPQLWLI